MKKGRTIILSAVLALAVVALALMIALRAGAFTQYTLTFTVGGSVTEMEIRPGDTVDVSELETAPEGYSFLCWLDSDGNAADPSASSGSGNYTALIAPSVTSDMSPWLEYDELGRLLPGENVTGAQMADAVYALFDGRHTAEALAELDTVSESELAAELDGLFLPGTLDAYTGTEPLTRLEAAVMICTLAGIPETAYDYAPAPDLPADTPGASYLAACADPAGAVGYEPGAVSVDGYFYLVDETGLFVTNAEADGLYYGEDGRCVLPDDMESGYVNLGGYLYYVGEDGRFATDEEIGGLYFASNGRYTSGSTELDGLVAGILTDICAENETREEMLRAAFNYVRDGFEYLRRNYYSIGETGWEVEEATTMFTTGRGNCYNYAAAFWALARGLGYDAYAVSGTMGWDYEPHGWVIIYDENGTRLTYDTETEMAYHRDGVYDRDMFAMNPWYAAGWNYYYG